MKETASPLGCPICWGTAPYKHDRWTLSPRRRTSHCRMGFGPARRSHWIDLGRVSFHLDVRG